ncbi:MAG: NAD(P)/FAD-dependent oxidoreductase [Rhodobacterales bacterium]
MEQDVVIIGGSFAGLSAAMQLARARKAVLVLDTGQPRNRFAATSHGFPGQDGQRPEVIRAGLRAELAAYPTVTFRDAEATTVTRDGAGFRIQLADGGQITARRIILAYGVRDTLPDLPGLRERWGVSVLHCPYCHGYELNGQAVGVLARDESSLHQAMILPDWGQTVLFTQALFTPSSEQAVELGRRGVSVETSPVVALIGDSPALEAVQLQDGRRIPLAGLFLAPLTAPASDLADQLGCAVKDGPTGPYLAVDVMQATSVAGVFAAGDLASPMPNATLAAAAGVMAGGAAHRSLIFDPDLAAA